MSDQIKHECGIALIRLLKPLDYYLEKYGTSFYGLNKLYLLMEKQHNRGQDGAGVVNVKLNTKPGQRYLSRYRSNADSPLKDIFGKINHKFVELQKSDKEKVNNPFWLKENLPFTGEIFLGHLRYGTYGGNSIESCHPFLRLNNWKTRNLAVAGNFNLTNVEELFQQLVELGQHPKEKADTVTVMERIGHFLDVENDRLFRDFKNQGFSNSEISDLISENLDIERILKDSSKKWDGGYTMAGLIGNGDSFVLRDPNGIRPAFYYHDDEIAVVCSERPVIQTAFNLKIDQIKELSPGHALIIKCNGDIKEQLINEPGERTACSFERIYFSRGSDADIYKERKLLGHQLVPQILKTIDHDLVNTVFSFIPNTAEIAFYGLVKGMEDHLIQMKINELRNGSAGLSKDELSHLLGLRPRVEKIAIKDAKLRTFITDDAHRDEMVTHVYDITYGTIHPGVDSLVILDDSIVRGTTLKQSIIRILDRLEPARIIIVSSAPQIRYPDCYGIDMAKLGDFVAFQAAVSLLHQRGLDALLNATYLKAIEQNKQSLSNVRNVVKEIYQPFTAEEISTECARLLTPPGTKAKVDLMFQTIEGLHAACPNNKGDWYFSGNYPTPGGNRVANNAFINYMEGKNVRAY
jgi:amidophosphoribosyltransferase